MLFRADLKVLWIHLDNHTPALAHLLPFPVLSRVIVHTHHNVIPHEIVNIVSFCTGKYLEIKGKALFGTFYQ